MNVTELAQAIRGGLIQQDRLLKTDIPSLPNNALVPRRAVTRSELGRDFSVVLDLVSTASEGGGYDFSNLNDGERAKMLYLSHHLGAADAKRYLAGTIAAEDTYTGAKPHRPPRLIARGAKTRLTAQVGSAAAAKRAEENRGNYVKAHRLWLSHLIDTGVNFKNFACDASKLEDVRPLLDLVTVVGGTNPTF